MVLVGTPEEKNHLEDLDVDGNIILKFIFKNWHEEWTELIWFSVWGRWRALVISVMNLWVPQNARRLRSAEDMLASHEGYCSLELVIEELSRQTSVTFRVKTHNLYV